MLKKVSGNYKTRLKPGIIQPSQQGMNAVLTMLTVLALLNHFFPFTLMLPLKQLWSFISISDLMPSPSIRISGWPTAAFSRGASMWRQLLPSWWHVYVSFSSELKKKNKKTSDSSWFQSPDDQPAGSRLCGQMFGHSHGWNISNSARVQTEATDRSRLAGSYAAFK